MSQLRKDPITGRWVIVDVEDPKNASDYTPETHVKSSKVCPFCPGNESYTPPEIVSVQRKSGAKNTGTSSNWLVRVIPNKFPALRIEEKTDKEGVGIYDKIGGFGAHEVIIETPDHDKELADLPIEHMELVLKMYRDRCLDLRKDPRFKYIIIFKNYGAAAGASLEHPHSQLIALPIVPSRVSGEIKGAQTHFDHTERCLYCDILSQEKGRHRLTVLDEEEFAAIMPFASRFPFETWVMPKVHFSNFDDITDEQVKGLASVMKKTFLKLRHALKDPSFNFMIHTLPIQGKETDTFHWHIEIIPHLTRVAGFELGTGFYVNATPPEMAAETLRKAEPVS